MEAVEVEMAVVEGRIGIVAVAVAGIGDVEAVIDVVVEIAVLRRSPGSSWLRRSWMAAHCVQISSRTSVLTRRRTARAGTSVLLWSVPMAVSVAKLTQLASILREKALLVRLARASAVEGAPARIRPPR